MSASQPTIKPSKAIRVLGVLVIAIASVGYFVGLQSPMNPADRPIVGTSSGIQVDSVTTADQRLQEGVLIVPASTYSELPDRLRSIKSNNRTSLALLAKPPTTYDPLELIAVSEEQKLFALALRERHRSFNGAPPTIPHPIDQMSAAACNACHGEGASTETLRIPKMSHQFLENCTQCHVETDSQHFQSVEFAETTFVGLPAPTGGPRAYPGAPPQIPHSTWMRIDCLSCHGFTGDQGLKTTHPWRQNCQQCHTPSIQSEQIQLRPIADFLPPLKTQVNSIDGEAK